MDSLLPSEIARLVLGYLENEKCNDAARSFLETSPHLDECRAVTTSGRRFGTRVNGFTLTDILEKFCAANAIIQERLSKVSDCERLKHCGDLSEQLRFLVDGSRAQRFVVNINVPQTTSQTSGGSPIISSSVRKQNQSGGERDRSKRSHKSHSRSWRKSAEPVLDRSGCDAVETTSLEHLPGHCGSGKSDEGASKERRPADCCSSTIVEAIGNEKCSTTGQRSTTSEAVKLKMMPEERGSVLARDKFDKSDKCDKCSMANDTEQLMRFTNTEVQTTPYDVAESENEFTEPTELTDEPVENLSLLTKELLNRTELQERIAENINKAILPADISLRDVSLSETLGGDVNTSIMTELNNAIKSVVTATESDPVFANFLDEIIGKNAENYTSPDEDGAAATSAATADGDDRPFKEEFSNVSPEFIAKTTAIESSTPREKQSTRDPTSTPEIPLKNRLRSSATHPTIETEDDRTKPQEHVEKNDTALEDLNAAAILSIINANNKLVEEKLTNVDATDEGWSKETQKSTELLENASASQPVKSEISEPTISATNNAKTLAKKATSRKSRPKSKPQSTAAIPEKLISEEEIMAMPTLIFSSKEEMSCFIGAPPEFPKSLTGGGYCASQFIPIAPKTSENLAPKPEPIFLRTVNVPMQIPNPPEPEKSSTLDAKNPSNSLTDKFISCTSEEDGKKFITMENLIPKSLNTVIGHSSASAHEDDHLKTTEKITLYGNERITILNEAVLPSVSIDASSSISGTGLSPFLKFKKITDTTEQSLAPKDNEIIDDKPDSTTKQQCYEILTKRTPRSLLKSRSKNHRLSLSTPRRRSNHIRALNFNTPMKSNDCSRRLSINDSSGHFSPKGSKLTKNVCRTSLFKSPPYTGTLSTTLSTTTGKTDANNSVNSTNDNDDDVEGENDGDVEDDNSSIITRGDRREERVVNDRKPCSIPIATRSPLPKLIGGWEKYTGVGIMIGSDSPSSTSSSPIKNPPATNQTVKKSWDADLRESLKLEQDPPKIMKKDQPKKQSQINRKNRKRKNSGTSVIRTEGSNRDVKSDATEFCARTLSPPSVEDIEGKSISTEMIANTADCLTEGTKKDVSVPASISNDNIDKNRAEVQRKNAKTIDNVTNKNVIVKKKYVQLKTIATTIGKLPKNDDTSKKTSIKPLKQNESSIESGQNNSESNHPMIHQLPNMVKLETPRKFDNTFGIPPTPRFLSPSNNSLIAQFVSDQIGEDSLRVQSFVPTPDFPHTPCIAVTPNHFGENTIDAASKNDELACSNYYQPSSELKDPRLPKQQDDLTRLEMSLPLPGIVPTINVKNVGVNVNSQTCTIGGKFEITQFEVIKENLPRDKSSKELNITTRISDDPSIINDRVVKDSIERMADATTMAAAAASNPPLLTNDVETIVDKDKNVVTIIDDESLHSGSSCSSVCSSSSSSSSSSSCSSSSTSSSSSSSTTSSSASSPSSSIASTSSASRKSNVTKKSANLTHIKQQVKKIVDKIYTDTSNESVEKSATNVSAVVVEKKIISKNIISSEHQNLCFSQLATNLSSVENETSPKKVFPIFKTGQILEDCAQTETPVKDETLLAEADISETPSSSKAGFDNVTNLTSKISAFISTEENNRTNTTEKPPRKSLPKITSIQRILPDVSVAIKPAPLPNDLCNAMQNRPNSFQQLDTMSNAKLSRQLEEKRLRMLAKFKEKNKTPAYRPRIKRTVSVAKASKRPVINESNVDKMRIGGGGEERTERSPFDDGNDAKDGGEGEEENGEAEAEAKPEEKEREKTKRQKKRPVRTKPESYKKIKMFKDLFDKSPLMITKKTETIGEKITEIEKASTNTNTIVDNENKNKPMEKHEKNKKLLITTAVQIASSSTETKIHKQSGKLNEKVCQPTLDNKKKISQCSVESEPSRLKDKEREENIAMDSNKLPKSKVDLVKRDLFSDEESTDQRTTRSRTRQISELPKNNSIEVETIPSTHVVEKNNSTDRNDDNLPGVLECLDLVPTIKTAETTNEDTNVLESSQCHAEYNFIYNDDAVSTKKRKRKYSSSELEFSVEVELVDDDYKMAWKLMTATVYEEIFNLSPPRKKRGHSKETIKVNKKYDSQISNEVRDKPLATSSPVVRPSSSLSNDPGKSLVKSHAVNKIHLQHADTKKKLAIVKTGGNPSENEKTNPKSCKRKTAASGSREHEVQQVCKKPRVISNVIHSNPAADATTSNTNNPPTTNPRLLLRRLDLDKFLTTVHGPA